MGTRYLEHKTIAEGLKFSVGDGILDEVDALALKCALAWQIVQEMKRQKLTKTVMEEKMHTTRPVS